MSGGVRPVALVNRRRSARHTPCMWGRGYELKVKESFTRDLLNMNMNLLLRVFDV